MDAVKTMESMNWWKCDGCDRCEVCEVCGDGGVGDGRREYRSVVSHVAVDGGNGGCGVHGEEAVMDVVLRLLGVFGDEIGCARRMMEGSTRQLFTMTRGSMRQLL